MFMCSLQQPESEEDEAAVNFVALIYALLKDPQEREEFFLVRLCLPTCRYCCFVDLM